MYPVCVLTDLDCEVLEAADGVGALEYLRSGKDIDLLVTGMRLPGMSGRQIADAARELRPRLKVLFVTGFADGAALSPQNLQCQHGSDE